MRDISSLVDRITEEVLRELSKRGGQPAAAPEPRQAAVSPSQLAGMIDHTLLKPDVTRQQIVQISREALQFGFAAVCVNPVWVRQVTEILRGSAVKTCAVVGFPLGATMADVKAYETRRVILEGAAEVDMVINIGALKGGDLDTVENDIRGVVQVARACGAVVKVIIETGLLSRDEKVTACLLSKKAAADFVKTSTGFAIGGATAPDIKLMRETVGAEMRVKASGGVRSYADAVAMVHAGADRIGTSSGVSIVRGD